MLRDAVIALLPHRDTRTEAAAPTEVPPRPAVPPAVIPVVPIPPVDPSAEGRSGVDLGKEHPALRFRPLA
ncbi:hypothetical protein ACFQ0M_10860 [Kitasatospora aburaviensis]